VLKRLALNNVLFIDNLVIEFGRGLCAITGETGAGKSILLNALKFILGDKISRDSFRRNSTNASIGATFEVSKHPVIKELLEDLAIPYENSLNIRRMAFEDGRTKAFVNDVAVSLSTLKKISHTLVEFHGQNEQISLLDSRLYREIIDEYGRLHHDLHALGMCFAEWRESEKKLITLKQQQSDNSQEMEYLTFVITELEKLNLQDGEEEELLEKRKALTQKQKTYEVFNEIYKGLTVNNDVEAGINFALRSLQRVVGDENKVALEMVASLERASIEMREVIAVIEGELEVVEEEIIDNIENRLFTLKRAAKKCDCMVSELPQILQANKLKLEQIQGCTTTVKNAELRVAANKEKFERAADIITSRRKKIAKELEVKLQLNLAPLKLEKAKLDIVVTQVGEEEWSKSGKDLIEFRAKLNPGVDFAPINKIASGGELSRFMLALKVVLAEVRSTPIIVFDEVDTGIGGATADAVGKKLQELGDHLQILIVTHQPQVAARASHHLLVLKKQGEDSTTVEIKLLDEEQRKVEIARMLSGQEITEEALAAADKLLLYKFR
jgi:DNA repair protein RecN (Recombination protein N)